MAQSPKPHFSDREVGFCCLSAGHHLFGDSQISQSSSIVIQAGTKRGPSSVKHLASIVEFFGVCCGLKIWAMG
jgi:hypothetical protein